METCRKCGTQYLANTGHLPDDCFIPPTKCKECGKDTYNLNRLCNFCNNMSDNPWVKLAFNLYKDLSELTKGEECDHAVNICWCNVFDHMNKAKEMLNRVCADL